MDNRQSASVIELRSRRRYAPGVVGLACAKVAAARAHTGLSLDGFADALMPLLGWRPTPGLIATWEQSVDPPGRVIVACEVILSRSRHATASGSDDIAAAVSEAQEHQAWLLAEPGLMTAEALQEDAAHIAQAPNRSARELFSAARQIRSRAIVLAGDAHRPGTLTDLYSVAGQATALMASAAFDLNRWDASAALTRSAISYAEMVGHASLQAWTLGLAALLANWRNHPRAALEHFRRGLAAAPEGTPRVRLRHIAARSYALLGDTDSVTSVLRQAQADLDRTKNHDDALSGDVGGEFAFSRARADACAAAAWLDAGCGGQAQDTARRALDGLMTMPREQRSVSQVIGARIDLAAGCLLSRKRDDAEDLLGHVFAVPSPLRNVSLSGRLLRVRRILRSPSWAGDRAARQLEDALSGWLAS